MDNKVKPAVIGGVVLGLLSAIPFVNFVNACCCLWAILGGLLASYLYVKNSPTPVSAGDGAIVGAIAGVVGGLISLIVGIPLAIVSNSAMQSFFLGLVENMDSSQAELFRTLFQANPTVTGAIVSGLIQAVLLFIFAIIGGLIGIPLFEKRKGGPLPPPPPTTGGTPYAA